MMSESGPSSNSRLSQPASAGVRESQRAREQASRRGSKKVQCQSTRQRRSLSSVSQRMMVLGSLGMKVLRVKGGSKSEREEKIATRRRQQVTKPLNPEIRPHHRRHLGHAMPCSGQRWAVNCSVSQQNTTCQDRSLDHSLFDPS